MFNVKSLKFIFSISILFVFFYACSDDKDCSPMECNSGILNMLTCNCYCPANVLGINCERFDSTKVQDLLDAGYSPQILVDAGIPLDSIYGKTYSGGLLFYLDTTNGHGLVASLDNLPGPVKWGCFTTDINSLPNVLNYDPNKQQAGARIGDGNRNTVAILNNCNEAGIAAKLCKDLGPNWYLPSISELFTMYNNLKLKGHGFFYNGFYWSSTEKDLNQAWLQNFEGIDHVNAVKSSFNSVRAISSF